jgi:zinc protease
LLQNEAKSNRYTKTFFFSYQYFFVNLQKNPIKMKKLSLLFVLISIMLSTFAQTPTPVDPAWRIGKLDNGMTYYIRKNVKPENKASFYIVHDIGALWETHNQNGLAHFLEHMAFNGLQDFPGKTMLEYMQSIGCAFGRNVNASTGQKMTNYLLTDVPLVREGIVDTCLLILKNWSGGILCEQSELDAERGVIREEWRTGHDANERSYNEYLKTLYAGTPYATRSVIGDTSIINNFKQEEILDFYHAWYRPNLQAIVLVGDFDVDKMESKVKMLFSTLKNPENPKTKAEFTVPDNIEPIINVYTDKELTQSSIQMSIKFPAKFTKAERSTMEYTLYSTKNSLITSMINARLQEVQEMPNSPLMYAYAYISNMVAGRDAFNLYLVAKNSMLEQSYEAVMNVFEQVKRYGFLPTELERVKKNILNNYESDYKNRNSRNSTEYYNRAAYSNFLENYSLMSEEQRWNFGKDAFPKIGVDELNNFIKTLLNYGPNTLVYADGPDAADIAIPDEEVIGIIMYGSEKRDIKPYEDFTTDLPLIAKMPKAGKVTKDTKNVNLETIEWTLSNGIKVVIKPTTFREDEISLTAFAEGGHSLVSDEDLVSAQVLGYIVNQSGLSSFSDSQLTKMLAGKKVNTYVSLNDKFQDIGGSCSPKDFETLLQLLYLHLTAPRFDRDDYESAMQSLRTQYINRPLNPESTMQDSMENVLCSYHPRYLAWTLETLDGVSFEKIQNIYKQRFANPGNFTVMLVGNVDLKTARPLIEKYLGGLPKATKKEVFKEYDAFPLSGIVDKAFSQQMKVAKSTVNIVYSGDMAYTPENSVAMTYLTAILRLRYTEEIREKSGGNYGASVYNQYLAVSTAKPKFQLTIAFDTDPKMKDELIQVAIDELQKIADNGPLADDFDKTQKNQQSLFQQNLKENRYWSGTLSSYYRYNKDLFSTYQSVLDNTDAAAIQELAKYILATNNRICGVMSPAE